MEMAVHDTPNKTMRVVAFDGVRPVDIPTSREGISSASQHILARLAREGRDDYGAIYVVTDDGRKLDVYVMLFREPVHPDDQSTGLWIVTVEGDRAFTSPVGSLNRELLEHALAAAEWHRQNR